MRLLRAHTRLGALPPNPQDLPLFFPPEWSSLFWISRGQEHSLSPAFPAAEPVARVASQHCPIPSASGDLRMDYINLAVPYFFNRRRLPP